MLRLSLHSRLCLASVVLWACGPDVAAEMPGGSGSESDSDFDTDAPPIDTSSETTQSDTEGDTDTDTDGETDSDTDLPPPMAGRCQRIVPEPGAASRVAWAFHCTSIAEERIAGAGVDAAGNVAFAFTFRGWDETAGATLEIGDEVVEHIDGAETILGKLDPDGNVIWTRVFAGPEDQWLHVADVCGDTLLVAGDAEPGSLDLGGGPLQDASYLALFDAAGDSTSARSFPVQGRNAHATVGDLTCDAQGNVFAVGGFRDGIDLGGGTIPGAVSDGWIASWDAALAHRWSRSINSTGFAAHVGSVALTPDSGVVVMGSFDEDADFGNGQRTAAGGDDAFIARYDAGGMPLWDLQIGPEGLQYDGGIAVSNDGTLAITGIFLGDIELGAETYSNVFPDQIPDKHGTNYDAFIAMLDGDGNYLWSEHAGTMLDDHLAAPVFAPDDTMIITGVRTEGAFFAEYVDQELTSDTPLPREMSVIPIADGGLLVYGSVGGEELDFFGVPLEGLGGSDVLIAKLLP